MVYVNLWHMSENEIKDSSIQNDEVRLYELGINLIATQEEKILSDFEVVKNIIKTQSGEVKSESTPVVIPLAYTMFKNVDSKNIRYNTAAFGWVKFVATPDKIELIKEELDLNFDILRYVILKTTEDANTDSTVILEALSEKTEVDERKGRRNSNTEEESSEEVAEVAKEEESSETPVKVIDEAIDTLVEETK